MNIDNTQFKTFLTDIKQKIYSAKSKAVLSANRLMIELYFEIGKEIVSKQEVLGWGKSVVEKMSKELVGEFGEKSGYSASNLWRMRNFYLAYKNNKKLYEREVENQLIENIKNFLLELGYGFSFIDSQYKLTLEENEYYIDLLFFHRKLNALVAIELKLGKYKPEYAGKMNFYLNLLNDTVKMPHENPSIGIILCTDKNKLEVEYSLKSISQPMGVSTYTMQKKLPNELKNALPTKEELEELVKDDLEKIEGKTK